MVSLCVRKIWHWNYKKEEKILQKAKVEKKGIDVHNLGPWEPKFSATWVLMVHLLIKCHLQEEGVPLKEKQSITMISHNQCNYEINLQMKMLIISLFSWQIIIIIIIISKCSSHFYIIFFSLFCFYNSILLLIKFCQPTKHTPTLIEMNNISNQKASPWP